MQVVQQQSPTYHCQISSISPQASQEMSTRIVQPLIFSIDDRLAEQHLTQLDLSSKHLNKIEQLPANIDFNIVLLDRNEITKLEHLDIYPQLIQVRKIEIILL
jgi:hypothetical protein